MIETSVALTGPLRRRWIDLVEIVEHCFDGSMHAVGIESVKAGKIVLTVRVPLPQPFDKARHDGVTPHPGRETANITQGSIRAFVIAAAHDEALNTKTVPP